MRTPRKDGGLGHMDIPLVADTSKTISKAYGVLVEDENGAVRSVLLRAVGLISVAAPVIHLILCAACMR